MKINPSPALALLSLLNLLISAEATSAFAESPIEFNRDVLPVLSERCFACHGFDAKARQSGLRLDTFDGATSQADSGMAAIVPGKPEESELVKRINSHQEGFQMPPSHSGKPLSTEHVELIRRWIAAGAKYEQHWSFKPPQASEPPHVEGVSHPIDRFIQYRLQQAKLKPSDLAPQTTQLRRVYLDVIGLPPAPQEIQSFVQEYGRDPEAAYQELVDQQLNSPHYGERWGRWWLDQARYADSNGYSIDAPREIWKFRDWVIEALNDDLSFDQFTIEQLAGDLLPDATQSQKIATGFHRNTQINQEGGIDPEQFRIDSVFDRVATTGSVWLGLTIGCCQCHDHKFDPISQKEYYQFFAFFNNQDEPMMKVYGRGTDIPELKARWSQAARSLDDHIARKQESYDAWESKLTDEEKKKLAAPLRKALELPRDKRSPAQIRDLFNIEVGKIDSDYQTILQTYTELDGRLNGEASTMVLQERREPRKTTIFVKGDFTRPAEQVSCGTPGVLHSLESDKPLLNRLDLANWIIDRRNPLTARVIVNRVWQQYFGKGLVETENDFGTLGTLPSHPELLDWLALEFQKTWSLKALHRLILTSHTYRQSSNERPDLKERDPNNDLLARQRRLRLDAEIVRDVGLSVSGLLVSTLGGPPVFPPIPDGVMNLGQVKRVWKVSDGEDQYRRAIYTFVYRATPPPALNVFDAPDGFSACTRRSRSNTPLQALTLLNDAAFFDFAKFLQARIEKDGLEQAFLACTAREPTAEDLRILKALDSLSAARVLLNLDETMTRE